MPLSELLETPLQRLVPHEGMVVDVAAWKAAHDYHVVQQRLHAMAMHSPGIVTGLEVVAWNPPDNSVVINPGVATDLDGNTIIVGEPQRFHIQTQEAAIVYLTLQFREVPGQVSGQAGDDSQPSYVLEAYLLEERRELPDSPYIELARIQVSGSGGPIRDAGSLLTPTPDEIDLRFRRVSGPRPLGEVGIGLVPLDTDADGLVTHTRGVTNLVRAINSSTRYHAEIKGSVNLSEQITGCHLLILAGQREFRLEDEWVAVLHSFIERGGVLMGEACGTGGGAPAFRQSFIGLAEQLGHGLMSVERDHPVLQAYHLFAKAPDGASGPTRLVETNGVLLSDGDYGCLWNGGRPSAPAERETIRAATELGVNLVAFALERTRMRSARLSTA